ncbi:hypothetical protein [Sphingomonas sp. R86520]|uniref:hypothetical protein n=1 Tax=Sphingomonas sp. R86520 TaxID=3093859 RepID=UPI0036D284C9
MKIIAMFAAGALAAGTSFAAAPADAQRPGWDGQRGGGAYGHRGWNGPRHGYRGDHGDRGYRGYRGGYGGGGYGYRGPRGYGRSRVVCRIERGYYGPVRRCFRR